MDYFALIDANSFYCEVERDNDPIVYNQPIIVLSNNDGVAVSVSKESKKLGIKRGDNDFKPETRKFYRDNNVQEFSSNYELYGSYSNKVKEILSKFAPISEGYSIDETFLDLSGFDNYDLIKYGKQIIHIVKKWTGLPVCVGIGPTKTLAKVANKLAKQTDDRGVYIIRHDPKEIEEAIKITPIRDVWGIGPQYSKLLRKSDISTAFDFTQMSCEWVRKYMTVTGERTWRELKGEKCIEMEPVEPAKKNMVVSQSFGSDINDFNLICEAVSSFAWRASEKLRRDGLCTSEIKVKVRSNPFKDAPFYERSYTIPLDVPTNSGAEIVKRSIEALKHIYRPDVWFKKAEVSVLKLTKESEVQTSLFDTINRDKQRRLMNTVDNLNKRFGKQKVKFAVMGKDKKWDRRKKRISKCSTTNYKDLPVVNLNDHRFLL